MRSVLSIFPLVISSSALFSQIGNESFIGSPFYGVVTDPSNTITNQVGPYADFSIPVQLNVKSSSNTLYSNDEASLGAFLSLDDGSVTRLDPSTVNWGNSNSFISIQNGMLSTSNIPKNSRVPINASAEGFTAVLFVRLKAVGGTLPEDPTVPINAFTDSVDLAQSGWKQSSWFGNYFDAGNNWIHHTHHGWLYTVSDSISSAWLWSPSQKWLWTNPDIYPHLYRNFDGSWIYFIVNALPQKVYYNQSTKNLEQ